LSEDEISDDEMINSPLSFVEVQIKRNSKPHSQIGQAAQDDRLVRRNTSYVDLNQQVI